MAWVKLPPINFNLSYIFNSLLIGTACHWRVSKWRAGELKCCPQVSVSASGLPPPPSGEASRAPAPVSPDPGVHVDTPDALREGPYVHTRPRPAGGHSPSRLSPPQQDPSSSLKGPSYPVPSMETGEPGPCAGLAAALPSSECGNVLKSTSG